MCCYTRHLTEILARTGIEHNRQNTREADSHIRRILAKEEANCPTVWREVKSCLATPEKIDELVERLKEAFAGKSTQESGLH